MRIGIDARLYGTRHTGIGRYVQNLIKNLGKIDHQNEYVVFGGEELKTDVSKFKNFKWIKLDTRVYTFAEQLVNPFVFSKEKLDLLHVPHFNAPILYHGRMVITIHDLIKHISIGKATTTLPGYQYAIKHLVYRFAILFNAHRAVSIITPANYWRDHLTGLLGVPQEKIFVTYEAATKIPAPSKDLNINGILNKYRLHKPFLIYTGNLYPHKNVEFLINAVREFDGRHEHHLELALVCARSTFTEKYKEDDTIKILGYVPDKELSVLYTQALALVQPSLIEGFGLTGLEAMSVGLPVLSSNATCLPEIYGEAALYFDPKNIEELINKIETVFHNPEIAEDLIHKGLIHFKSFSWYKMAKETLKIYQASINK